MTGLDRDDALFGFSHAEWIASGAFSAAGLAFVRQCLARGQSVSIQRSGWLALARLSPGHARRVWASVGPEWTADLEQLEADCRQHDLDAAVQQVVARLIIQLTEELAELQRLAGVGEA